MYVHMTCQDPLIVNLCYGWPWTFLTCEAHVTMMLECDEKLWTVMLLYQDMNIYERILR